MDRPALKTSTAQWRQIRDVNVTGTFVVCREFAQRVADAGLTGTIVNVASMSGLVVNVPGVEEQRNSS